MLKGKSTIELTDVHTGKKEIYRDENLVTEAIADILNTNIKGAMFNNPYFDGKYGEDWMLPIYSRLTGGLLLYGTTVSAIQSMNSSLIQNVNLILVGWKIRVK